VVYYFHARIEAWSSVTLLSIVWERWANILEDYAQSVVVYYIHPWIEAWSSVTLLSIVWESWANILEGYAQSVVVYYFHARIEAWSSVTLLSIVWESWANVALSKVITFYELSVFPPLTCVEGDTIIPSRKCWRNNMMQFFFPNLAAHFSKVCLCY